jgi:hypothetical protein
VEDRGHRRPAQPDVPCAELWRLVDDCRPVCLFVGHGDADKATATLTDSSVAWLIGVNQADFQTRIDHRIDWEQASSDLTDLATLLGRVRRPPC